MRHLLQQTWQGLQHRMERDKAFVAANLAGSTASDGEGQDICCCKLGRVYSIGRRETRHLLLQTWQGLQHRMERDEAFVAANLAGSTASAGEGQGICCCKLSRVYSIGWRGTRHLLLQTWQGLQHRTERDKAFVAANLAGSTASDGEGQGICCCKLGRVYSIGWRGTRHLLLQTWQGLQHRMERDKAFVAANLAGSTSSDGEGQGICCCKLGRVYSIGRRGTRHLLLQTWQGLQHRMERDKVFVAANLAGSTASDGEG